MSVQEPEYQQHRISVPKEFESIFSHFYFAGNDSGYPVTKTLLPSYQTILLFCFGAAASMTTREKTTVTVDKCIIFGPIRHAFEYTLPPGTSILVANFQGDAFFRFFGKITTPRATAIHPDELVTENCFTDLWYQLTKLNKPTEQVDHILEFCKPYLQNQENTSRLLSTFDGKNLNPIKTIAEKTGQSERNIQLKHKEQFGYSAKEINRYNRFLKAVRMIEREIGKHGKVEWFSIIHACNYYDQSQLIHDFNYFMNISPSRYLKFQQDICNPASE